MVIRPLGQTRDVGKQRGLQVIGSEQVLDFDPARPRLVQPQDVDAMPIGPGRFDAGQGPVYRELPGYGRLPNRRLRSRPARNLVSLSTRARRDGV